MYVDSFLRYGASYQVINMCGAFAFAYVLFLVNHHLVATWLFAVVCGYCLVGLHEIIFYIFDALFMLLLLKIDISIFQFSFWVSKCILSTLDCTMKKGSPC